MKQNSPASAVSSNVPLPSRSMFFVTVIWGISMMAPAGTLTTLLLMFPKSPGTGASSTKVLEDDPLQPPASSVSVRV